MTDREVIRQHSKSFALAARLLPRARREQAEALYAWCRTADDRIDLACNRVAAESALAELRAEVEDVYAGRPVAGPAADALRRAVVGCGLPREYPLDMLAGFEMDVLGARYQTEAELLLYCHRVAGVVGLMMCHALGVTDDAALPHAAHLGIAMQLTNIARDVAEDWARGRLYLPAEWLAGVPWSEESLDDELFAPAVQRCLELAERYYRSGEVGLKYLAPRCRLAIATAARVYQAIGTKLAAAGYRPTRGRAVVSTCAKAGILTRTSIRLLPALLRDGGPLRRPVGVGTFAPLPPTAPSPTPARRPAVITATRSWRETASSVVFALALTAVLAATLFVVMALNPKELVYGNLPWYYAGICVLAAPPLFLLSRKLDGDAASPDGHRPLSR